MSIFIYLTGNGDKRDVSSENGEGSGGRSHPWDQGTRGHHRVHQAGADGKGVLQAFFAKLAQTGSVISVSFIPCKNRRAFCPFFLLLSGHILSFLLPSQVLVVSHSSYQFVSHRCWQRERERQIQEFAFFSNLMLTLIREITQDKDDG